MSRELLKRALEIMNKAGWFVEHEAYAYELMEKIKTYLAQPEPEPVAWVNGDELDSFEAYDQRFTSCRNKPNGYCKTPLYASPPDQSTRVGVLIAEHAVSKAREAIAKAKGEV